MSEKDIAVHNVANSIRGMAIIAVTTGLLVADILPVELYTFLFGVTFVVTWERFKRR